jgi:hypothetical protein
MAKTNKTKSNTFDIKRLSDQGILLKTPQQDTKPAPENIPPGPPGTEIFKGYDNDLKLLALMHVVLEPRLYLEIGVRLGNSLRLAQNRAVGIDPEFDIQ